MFEPLLHVTPFLGVSDHVLVEMFGVIATHDVQSCFEESTYSAIRAFAGDG